MLPRLGATINSEIGLGNHWRRSGKKGVLKIYAKFKGSYLCMSLFFNKVIKTKFLLKKLLPRCLHVNFTKFLRTPIL